MEVIEMVCHFADKLPQTKADEKAFQAPFSIAENYNELVYSL
jgi:hypothetical protein